MDNKKQLIIVPPMSEALKKLNEVLEGIASDENIEISMIDDLKELGQVVAATGQCLVLTSNAKKCATFLQENKATISRTHTKTMLFTPKEIPAKTLIKFTKVGLTESILENSAPKTLLYKIKLQLRSIKTVSSQQEKEKEVIKNSTDTSVEVKPDDEKVKERAITEQFVEHEAEIKKKNINTEENVIDYGTNLKGKIKPQEESIDTHWKSKIKTDETKFDTDESGDTENQDGEAKDDIDLYYRGKRKKDDSLVEEESDYAKLKRLDNGESDEDTERQKKPSFIESLDEGYLKQKRLNSDHPEVEMDYLKSSKDNSQELSPGDELKKETLNYEPDEEENKKPQTELDLLAADDKKNKNSEAEDLGGYLKGKLSKVAVEFEPDLNREDEKEEYDNSELEAPEKKINLDLVAGENKAKEDRQEAEESDATHDSEVDHLNDEMMDGEGAVDHIETYMGGKTTTRKSDASLATDEAEENEDADYLKDDDDSQASSIELELTPAEKAEKKKNDYDNSEGDYLLKTAKKADMPLVADDDEDSDKDYDNGEETRDAATKLDLIPGKADDHNKSGNEDVDPHMSFKKLNNTSIDLDSADKSNNKSKVDKIDTYYRSGEAKKKEHSWDNLTDKDKSVKLDLIKNRKADEHTAGKEKIIQDGDTIDYRVLKKEFDMISRTESTGSHAGIVAGAAAGSAEADEDSSFKVIEPDSRPLVLAIHLVNSLINKTVKPKQMFSLVAGNILDNYQGHCVFYSFKQSEDKYTEVFSTYMDLFDQRVTEAKKEWWLEFKKSTELFKHYQTKSLTTWRSPEVIENGVAWEDVELPKWAKQELSNKPVELIFPYFDGLDKMGLALVFFPEGINPENELGILTSLELARALFLDTIQRYQVQPERIKLVEDTAEAPAQEKKNILSFFGGIFGRKKTG